MSFSPAIATQLVLEGGAIEVDGHGTAMMTESSVLNQNRNPGMSKSEFEALIKPLLGLRKIIWLPGIRGRDITDGHIDFYARFTRPGVVVAAYEPDPAFFDHAATTTNLDILRSETDADGRQLEVIVLENPQTIRPTFETDEFAAGYVNFYVVNGAVIIPEFGDALADDKAKSVLQDLYSNRDIVQLNIDADCGWRWWHTLHHTATTPSLIAPMQIDRLKWIGYDTEIIDDGWWVTLACSYHSVMEFMKA